MGILKIIENLSNIGGKITKVFFGERRKRARLKLERLKKLKKEIMSRPASINRVKKVKKLKDSIKKIQSYLQN